MAEVMTSESIIEAFWLLQGYWTKPRFAFKTQSGQWSDVDVLAYDPEAKHLAIAESKVQCGKWDVFAYTAERQKECGDLLSYDDGAYFSFLDRLPTLCNDGTIFDQFRPMVDSLTVQLVSNYFVTSDVKEAEKNVIAGRITGPVPDGIALDVRIDSTLEIICEIIWLESESEQGRRYGNPVLDIARELNRYRFGDIRNAGSQDSKEAVKEEIHTLLKDMLSLDGDENAE